MMLLCMEDRRVALSTHKVVQCHPQLPPALTPSSQTNSAQEQRPPQRSSSSQSLPDIPRKRWGGTILSDNQTGGATSPFERVQTMLVLGSWDLRE